MSDAKRPDIFCHYDTIGHFGELKSLRIYSIVRIIYGRVQHHQNTRVTQATRLQYYIFLIQQTEVSRCTVDPFGSPIIMSSHHSLQPHWAKRVPPSSQVPSSRALLPRASLDHDSQNSVHPQDYHAGISSFSSLHYQFHSQPHRSIRYLGDSPAHTSQGCARLNNRRPHSTRLLPLAPQNHDDEDAIQLLLTSSYKEYYSLYPERHTGRQEDNLKFPPIELVQHVVEHETTRLQQLPQYCAYTNHDGHERGSLHAATLVRPTSPARMAGGTASSSYRSIASAQQQKHAEH